MASAEHSADSPLPQAISAAELRARREEFSISPETIYKELRAHHGRMHVTLYAMPPSFGVVIGGLWYFAAMQLKVGQNVVALIVFLFAAAVTRYLFEAFSSFAARTNEMRVHLERTFEGELAFTADPDPDWLTNPGFRAEWREFLFSRTTIAQDKRSTKISDAGAKIWQTKTREHLRRVIQSAAWLSVAGAGFSILQAWRAWAS